MLDITDLSPLELLYLIGLLVLFLSAFIYAIYPLFCNCDNNSPSLDDIVFLDSEACFACRGQPGQACAMHCAACFQCMPPDLPCSSVMEEGERDGVTTTTTANTDKQQTEQPQQQQQHLPPPPPAGRRVMPKRNSLVQEDNKDTTANRNLENSMLDGHV